MSRASHRISANALVSKGIEAYLANNLALAKQLFLKAIEQNPRDVDALHHLGIVAYDEENFNQSIDYYQKALSINKNLFLTHFNLGNTYREMQFFKEALTHYEQCLSGLPDHIPALNNYALLLHLTGRLEESEKILQKILLKNSNNENAICNLITVLNQQYKYKEALEFAKTSCVRLPKSPDLIYQYATILREQGKDDKALEQYQKCLALSPNHGDARWNSAHLLLKRKNYQEGWACYEWRWRSSIFLSVNKVPHCHLPKWDGRILNKDESLFVIGEQGVGDQVMFMSLLPDVMSQTSHVVISCDYRLQPLLKRAFPTIQFYESGHQSCTHYIHLASLPQIFRQKKNDFEVEKRYLIPDNHEVQYYRHKYESMFLNKKIIGISWRGGIGVEGKRRSTHLISDWMNILNTPNVGWVNCQYGDVTHEILQTQNQSGMTIYQDPEVDPLKNLDSFASQLKALDLVISIDNSTVHLAGALNVPVNVLLPLQCEWRWGYNGNETEWYQSVKLYRQTVSGDWGSVFNQVKRDLLT